MTITRRLKIAALVPALLAVLIGMVLFVSARMEERLRERRTLAHRIVAGVNEMNNFVSSFVLYRGDRPKQQFMAQHDAVTGLMDAVDAEGGSQRQVLDDMRRDIAAAKAAFLKLVSHYADHSAEKSDPMFREVEERLRGQILIRCRSVASSATRLDNLVLSEIRVSERRSGAFVLILVAAAAGVLTLGSLRMMRHITDSLDRFRRGTEIVGRGDLTHRIGLSATDEIGRLAHAFDRMADDLRATTVSRDALAAEVAQRKRAEEENQRLLASLQQDGERFRALVTASSDVLYRMSPDWSEMRQLHSDGFLAETERPSGTWLAEYIHPDDQPRVNIAIQEAIRTKSVFELEHRVRRADGSLGWTFSRAVPLTDANGEIIEWFGAASDITERKRAEETLRELNAILEKRVAQRTAELTRRAGLLQKLTLELSQAEERERRRIAVILHEDLQQQLAGARFHLNLLKGRAKQSSRQVAVETVDEMLKEAIQKSRTLSHDLSPNVLNVKDLSELLQWLAQWVRARHGLTVRVEVSGVAILQSEALTIFLFRAAQEMLFNVVKHAQVDEAAIRVRRIGHYVYLCVSDRGRGFEPHELKETAGLGLLSIRERVELLGGRMKIKSVPGQGSRCHIVVPDGPWVDGRGQTRENKGQRADEIRATGPRERRAFLDDRNQGESGAAPGTIKS
jgi:signal transduction histidine kinase/HAMP domain-containing protein